MYVVQVFGMNMMPPKRQ